jgi:hypothetical protein
MNMQAEQMTVSCHEREIPSFVEKELERLYENIHCSVAFFREFRRFKNVSTYIVRKDGQPVTIFLFSCKDWKVRVLNEMINIDEQEIRRFADYVFAKFSSVSLISFHAIQTTVGKLPFPCQKCVETEDFSMSLPATREEYTASLGISTRDYIKRYSRKIIRRFPSFTCRCYLDKDIDEQVARAIINMSKAKMENKKKKFAANEREVDGLIRLAKAYGLVHAVLIDGRLCAGSIGYRVGSHHFVFIIAHDSAYDAFRLGTICYYLTICDSIARGSKDFHMGRGWYEYKRRLLGARQEFHRLVIYRSYRHMALQCGYAARTARDGYVRRLKSWLLHPRRQNSVISRFAVQLLHVFRKLRPDR